MSAASAAGAAAAETTGGDSGAAGATKTVVVASSKNAHESLFAVYRSRTSTPRELNTAARTYLSREKKINKKIKK
jgi:phosphoribosyl-AMP cyclohydrolase